MKDYKKYIYWDLDTCKSSVKGYKRTQRTAVYVTSGTESR